MKKAVTVALILSVAYGALAGYLNGTVPPPAWPPSVALLEWPTGSLVTLYVPLAVIWVACFLCCVPGWYRRR